mmetsp:Transcript_130381/g.237101  ORF Transcript_130381/g.237101 Transcript_130381/m.237101 type:complete len:215 (-) Transcript_130381:91-735(-)
MQRTPQPRRSRPLPPLDAPRGAHAAAKAVISASALASTPPPMASLSPSPGSAGSGRSSLVWSASRPSSTDTLGQVDLQNANHSSRSTSACSHTSGMSFGVSGDLLSSLNAAAPQEEPQADAVVKAVLPIIKRAMVSKNGAVFQASLDSMTRIQRMFGQDQIDKNIDVLAGAVEKQRAGPLGAERAVLILKALIALCSEEAAASLRRQFPQHVVA